MTAYTFPWASPPLTSNQRMHWARKAKITAQVRDTAALACRRFGPAERVEVSLSWIVRTKHRRDADNIVPTLKALCDGLVDAGIVPDDTPEYMVKRMPVIEYDPTAQPRMVLHVERLTHQAKEQ